MKKLGIILLFVSVFFFIGYIGTGFINDRYFKSKILSETSENTSVVLMPTSTETPSPTLSPTPSPSPKPTITPTPTPIPQPKITSSEIHSFMERFAGQYGVDVNVLRHIAVCESGFNPIAVNGPYAGLFQFNITAWKNNRSLMGEDLDPNLRFNAEEAIQTAAYLVSKGKRNLWPNCYP